MNMDYSVPLYAVHLDWAKLIRAFSSCMCCSLRRKDLHQEREKQEKEAMGHWQIGLSIEPQYLHRRGLYFSTTLVVCFAGR